MRILILLFVLCVCGLPALAQEKAASSKQAKQSVVNPNFPFIANLTTSEYDIIIKLDDPKILAKYADVFRRNNREFTSEAWEALITGLLDNDSTMHHQITTSAQKNLLRIGTGSDEYQKSFLDYLVPLFADISKIDAFLKRDD